MRLVLLAIAVAVAFVAMPAFAQPPDDDKVDAPRQVWSEVQAAAKSLGSSEASVTARMGKPLSRSVERKPNRHDASATDSVIKLSYPDAYIEIYEALSGSPDSRQFLLSVTLRADDDRLPARFATSAPKSEVLEAFGPPVSQEGETLSYHYYDPGIVSWAGVAYTFADGKLTSTKWWYNVH